MKKLILILGAFTILSYGFTDRDVAVRQFDICVYGETSSGIIAAIQAARMGENVVLLSTSDHLGGVMTSGLTATDINNHQKVGGVAREVFQKIYAHYEQDKAWRNQKRDSFFLLSKKRTFTGKSDSLKMQWVYESHVLEGIFRQMLQKAGIKVYYKQRLDLKNGVIKNGTAIESIRTTDRQLYRAKMFIDATYEGDLMAKSGVSYMVGREPKSLYNEVRAGVRINKKGSTVDPYLIKGDSTSGLLPFIESKQVRKEGTGDHKVQAYTYRVTLTNDKSKRIEIRKPKNYNPLWYELLARKRKAASGSLTSYITITPMPNRKTDTNHLDFVGASYEWAEADYEKREMIAQLHKDYALGLLWFLGNDERIPLAVRLEMKQWGLPNDEFKDNDNFPHQIYVRESRRMISDYVMTELNCRSTNRTDAPNSVGLGTYAFDSHNVATILDNDNLVKIEGSFFGPASIYPISYLSIIPKVKECSNLLVPICLSASHVAYSSIRMEPVYMVLGQSAGTAAALAIKKKTTLHDLSYSVLKTQLENDNQILK